jgi:hypothetical protein
VRGFMTASPDTVTTQAIADMRSWGANVFRLQINPVGCAKKLKKTIWEGWPEVLDSIDRIVADAGEQGMKVIVDLHLPPIQEIVEKRQFDKAELWKHPELETGFLRFWTDVARRLKPRAGHIWGYDLYNEPLDRSQLPWPPREWWPLAAKIIQAVREIDRDVWFIYEPGPGGMSRGFQGLEPLPDTRVIYSVHDYYPGAFTHQGISNVGGFDQTDVGRIRKVNYPPVSEGATLDRTEWRRRIAPVVEFRKKWRVPLYVGEFSVIRWAPKEDAVRWLKEAVACYEEFGWSWTYHAFREFHGWSLEHDETRPANIHAFPPPSPALAETGRAKVIKEAFRKNTFPE